MLAFPEVSLLKDSNIPVQPAQKSQLIQYQACFQSCYIIKPSKLKFIKN